MILQVGVKILLKSDDNKFLFLKRAASFESGIQKWDIPGGRINVEEALDEALAREVREETGLEIESYELLAAQDIFVHDKDMHVVRLTYVGTASNTSVVISNEHDEYKWMTKEQAVSEPIDEYFAKIKDRF